jgi:hypothetical protein
VSDVDQVDPDPEPSDLYRWLDYWSDGDLPGLAQRLRQAPVDQIRATLESWPLINPHLTAVPEGELRPIVEGLAGHSKMVAAGTRMLLYTRQIVVSRYLLRVDDLLKHSAIDDVRSELADQIDQLSAIRPLVEDGSIFFTDGKHQAIGRHPSRLFTHLDAMDRVPEDLWDPLEFGTPEPLSRRDFAGQLGAAVIAVERNMGNPVALTRNEELAFESAFGGGSIDARPVGLRKLAAISLPDFSGDTRALVALRANSDAFAEFRSKLASAMGSISEVPETADAAREAEAIFGDELSASMQNIKRESETSAVRALIAPMGVKRLTFAGIGFLAGAAAAAISGAAPLAPAFGAAGSVATSGIDIGQEAIKAAKARRDAKAVWDIVLAFRSGVDE